MRKADFIKEVDSHGDDNIEVIVEHTKQINGSRVVVAETDDPTIALWNDEGRQVIRVSIETKAP